MAPDKLFVSIAVSQPENLAKLPGAITAAKRMASWAKANGYATLLIHDEDHPLVSVKLLCQKITDAIREIVETQPLQRLVFFFAGHGAALAVGDQYWLLSQWEQRSSEAIKVSSLQRILEYYGPIQVSIIGDACQEFSSRFIDVVGSPILDRPAEDPRPYELDQFFAVDVGKQAFMIRAAGSQDAFCVFSEVLLDALEGDVTPDWLETEGQDHVVTSQSIARYLVKNVESEAGKYGVRMTPRPRPGFFTDRVYARIPKPSDPAVGSPVLPRGGTSRSARGPAGVSSGVSRGGPSTTRNTSRVMLKSTKGPELSPATSQDIAPGGVQQRLYESELHRQLNATEALRVPCGLVVSGANVVELSADAVIRTHGPNRFEVQCTPLGAIHRALDALVTLEDGRTYCVCLVSGFVSELAVLDGNTAAVMHHEFGEHYDLGSEIHLLSKAHAGLLQPDDLVLIANHIRRSKHRVLTLGCIAAQFYDLMRDTESLRSMASFYISHDQPIPLDIVLYGGGTLVEQGGSLFAIVESEPSGVRRSRSAAKPSFAFAARGSKRPHPVAGRVPWMRHAWGAIATAQYHNSALAWKALADEIFQHLAPGIFTNIRASGRPLALEMIRVRGDHNEPTPMTA